MGLLIALEGNDAAGKATQTKLLVDRLRAGKHEVAAYSFPRYDTLLGQTIERHLHEKIMVAERDTIGRAPEDALWFQSVCMIEKYETAPEIAAHLRAGHFVVCDRWKPSAIAFGTADNLDVNWLERAQERLPTADLNIFIAVSEGETLRRRPVLRDRNERDREKQKIVRRNYKRIWAERAADAAESKLWVVVDGEDTVDVVHHKIWEQVANAHVALGG